MENGRVEEEPNEYLNEVNEELSDGSAGNDQKRNDLIDNQTGFHVENESGNDSDVRDNSSDSNESFKNDGNDELLVDSIEILGPKTMASITPLDSETILEENSEAGSDVALINESTRNEGTEQLQSESQGHDSNVRLDESDRGLLEQKEFDESGKDLTDDQIDYDEECVEEELNLDDMVSTLSIRNNYFHETRGSQKTIPTDLTAFEIDHLQRSQEKMESRERLSRLHSQTRFKDNGQDWKSNASPPLLPPVDAQRAPVIRQHQWPYRARSRYLRNPFYDPAPICPKVCCKPGQWLTTTRYAGPDKRRSLGERKWARDSCLENKSVSETLDRPNPASSVPMRPRKWKRMTWVDEQEDQNLWKIKAEQEKDKKDHEKAHTLGYETLVGNIVYSNIPGAKDLNRSWKHFLDQDPMAWGFPYTKGSTERPRLPLPSPYLVHQMREQLWKYPRNKLILQSGTPTAQTNEESG